MKRMMTVVGARPQFIKAAAISRVIIDNYSDKLCEKIIHTGQHYDKNMSDIFFEELSIPSPCYNLNINASTHGDMTGRMIIEIENILIKEQPDILLLYGDTNSTLAGAIAGAKLNIPIAHIEAGLRSYNNKMPEEINRIITDRVSTWFFCPSQAAVSNLAAEGQYENVYNVGDVMYDACLYVGNKVSSNELIFSNLNIKKKEYVLVTCHRQENTEQKSKLKEILLALDEISRETSVVFSLHPRTRRKIEEFSLVDLLKNITVIEPLSYTEISSLLLYAKCLLTDSGGMQKEAFFYRTPCVTLRNETEWMETVNLGCNMLTEINNQKIISAYKASITALSSDIKINPYGDGCSAHRILDILK